MNFQPLESPMENLFQLSESSMLHETRHVNLQQSIKPAPFPSHEAKSCTSSKNELNSISKRVNLYLYHPN